MSKKAIAVFSNTNTTFNQATVLGEILQVPVYRIKAAVPYTEADLNWHDDQSRANREQNDLSTPQPALADTAFNTDFDVLYLGYPIWWSKAPRIIDQFLSTYDFTGKVVIPFATSGSSAIDQSVRELQQHHPNVTIETGKRVNNLSRQALTEWVQ